MVGKKSLSTLARCNQPVGRAEPATIGFIFKISYSSLSLQIPAGPVGRFLSIVVSASYCVERAINDACRPGGTVWKTRACAQRQLASSGFGHAGRLFQTLIQKIAATSNTHVSQFAHDAFCPVGKR